MCSKKAETRRRWEGERPQKMMDWASWEIARSTLDESIKNSIGILLYLDKIKRWENDNVRHILPSLDKDYTYTFAFWSLYFCHLHATLAGLSLAGVILRDHRYIVRDMGNHPRWKSINDSWQECWTRPSFHMRHTKVFKEYDSVQRHRATWLPRRSNELKSLKEAREALTYHTERLGGWDQKEAIERIRQAFPDHIMLQTQILEPLCEFVEEWIWNRSFNPKSRVIRLHTRFEQYQNLASYVFG